jgi:AcrR family transcriptional regulator
MSASLDTRTRIKNAALALFVAKGVAETTTRDLAREAGIAEGTLYRHYAAKEDLVHALFEEHYLAFGQRIAAAAAGKPSLAAKLDAIITDACALFDRDPTLYRFLLLTLNQGLPRLPKEGVGPVSLLRGMFADSSDSLVPDPNLAVSLFLGLLVQPAHSMIHAGLTPPLSTHAPAIAAAVRRALVR